MAQQTNINTPLSLGTIVFLVFLTLKLIPGTIVNSWSWWLIFAPLLIEAGLILLFIIISVIIIIIRDKR